MIKNAKIRKQKVKKREKHAKLIKEQQKQEEERKAREKPKRKRLYRLEGLIKKNEERASKRRKLNDKKMIKILQFATSSEDH